MPRRKSIDYQTFKARYKSMHVAANYETYRFFSLVGRWRNATKTLALRRAFSRIGSPGLVLDVPCGTGRFFKLFESIGARYAGCDISHEMILHAREKSGPGASAGFAVGDAEALPFRDASAAVVLSVRFLHQLPCDVRVRILREMARVAKEFVIVDYRFTFSVRNVFRIVAAAARIKPPFERRSTRRAMREELAHAGLEPVAVIPVVPFFSDKYVVVCRRAK